MLKATLRKKKGTGVSADTPVLLIVHLRCTDSFHRSMAASTNIFTTEIRLERCLTGHF